MNDVYWVPAEELRAFTDRALRSLGMTSADAALAAEILVEADLMGMDTHGIRHLYSHRAYATGLRGGTVNPRPQMRVVRETPGVAVLDGDGGFGPLVASRAVDVAIERARNVGVGVVAVHDSRHFGAAGYYAMQIAEQDMVGMVMTNAGPTVVPTYAKRRMIGTNPIAIAAPTEGPHPLVCDVTTSTVPMGKAEIAVSRGTSLEPGWGLDTTGEPTLDAALVLKEGGLTPLGSTPDRSSYKGYALAVAVEMFCGILTTTGWAMWLERPSAQAGHFVVAFDLAAFGEVAQLKSNMTEMLETLQAADTVDGAERVLVPGQPEFETRAERAADGVPLEQVVLDRLDTLAEEVEVAPVVRAAPAR